MSRQDDSNFGSDSPRGELAAKKQLVILARGVKVAIEQRTTTDARLAQMEQRIDAIEKRAP